MTLRDLARQSEGISERLLSLMKGRVEAGDLWNGRHGLRNRFDRAKIVGLVQGRKRRQRAETLYDLRSHDGRSGKFRTTVDDPMPDPPDRRSGKLLTSGRDYCAHGFSVAESFRRKLLPLQLPASLVAGRNHRRHPDLLDLPAKQERLIAFDVVDAELHARRTGVHNGDALSHADGPY